MKEIKLTKGRIALVDDADFDHLSQYSWHVLRRKNVYHAVCSLSDGTLLYMHRVIHGITDSKIFVDHKDRNGLNNQRENLRIATYSQNNANSPSRKGATSKYLGVHLFKRDNRWCAQIKKNGVSKNLGYFDTEEAAALAYNTAAIEKHGEFANLNKIAV